MSCLNAKVSKPAICALLATVSLFAAGCVVTSRLHSESRLVEIGSARSVRVEIRMDSGKLKVAGGAEDLLNADFKYNVASWRPRIKYELIDDHGKLAVEQPHGVRGAALGKVVYKWDLRLRDDVPLDLSVKLGVGRSDLQLGGLSLETLDIQTEAGNVNADLVGSTSLTQLNVEQGAGNSEIDLTGRREKDLNVNIRSGVGGITMRLPTDVGVRVNIRHGIGKVNANSLTKKGKTYVNEAYGRSNVTIDVDIIGGVGEINLKPAD